MIDLGEDESVSFLDLNLSEGPRKVLDTLQQINRETPFAQVCLSRNFASPIRAFTTESMISQVLDSIVSLPKAPLVKISYASATFPIHLLVEALANRNSAVETLEFLGVKLAYKQTLLATRLLKDHRHNFPLKSICLENCTEEAPPNSRIRKQQIGQPLDLFLAALLTISSLESIELRLIEKEFLQQDFVPFPYLKKLHLERLHVSETSLQNICRSPNLEELHLIFIVDPPSPQNLHVLQTLATVLGENHTLHTLQIKFMFHNLLCLEEAIHCSFWQSLAINDTIRNLDLTIHARMDPYQSVFGLPIALALQHNRSLQKLSLTTRIDDNDAARKNLQHSLIVIADALRSKARLQQFIFRLSGGLRGFSSAQVYSLLVHPFEGVLQDQYWLTNLTLWYRGVGQLQLKGKMQLYLDLNKAGRRHLLRGNPTREEWVDAVIANQFDLSIVFFLLSRNPLLCQ